MRSKTKLYVDGLLLVYYLLLWFVDTVAERYKRTESDKKLWEGRRASPLTPSKPTAKKTVTNHILPAFKSHWLLCLR